MLDKSSSIIMAASPDYVLSLVHRYQTMTEQVDEQGRVLALNKVQGYY